MAPMIAPDFSEAVDGLPAGEYPVRITDSALKRSEKSGNEYINWTLETFGKDDEKLNGRKVFHSTPIGGKGAGILKQLLRAVGVEATKEFDTDQMLGKEFIAVLKKGEEDAYPRVATVRQYNG